jgi:streptogramin lyase
MTCERLHRAAVALERSVAELDVERRLEELGRRHRRRRLTSLAMALVVSTAVLGGAVAAVQRGRGPERGGLGRIAPAGNRLTVVRVPRCCVGGLAGGEGALWAANAWDGTLVRLDPRSGRVLSRTALPLAAAQHPWQVAAGDGAVWVTSASDRLGTARVLWRVGPATGRLAGSMTLGPASSRRIPDAVATGDGTLWVATGDAGAVLRLAPRP